jgi:hypothetical protein
LINACVSSGKAENLCLLCRLQLWWLAAIFQVSGLLEPLCLILLIPRVSMRINKVQDPRIARAINLKEIAMGFLESCGYYQPSGDEDVTVIPNFFIDALQTEIMGNRKRTIMDVGKVMQTMCKGTFYQTKAWKLPQLIRYMKSKNPYLDLRNDLSIFALAEKRMIIPLSSKTMIELDPQTFMARLKEGGINSFFSPVERAMETISRTNPKAFQSWLPSSEMKYFLEQKMQALSPSKPTMVAF